MKETNPIFSLKNFRSFGEDGADFELAPITVLTGCNSSGKSSMVKALVLLSEKEKGHDGNNREIINFSSKQLCLGGYKAVAHEDKKITFSYRIWSDVLQEEVIVTKSFSANKRDALNQGFMTQLTLEKLDGTLIYQDSTTNPKYNTDAIKNNLLRLYAARCYERLLLHVKLKEKDFHSPLNLDSETALNAANDKLKAAGITKEEAILLFNSVNKKWFDFLKEELFIDYGPNSRLLENDFKNNDWWEGSSYRFIDLIVDNLCSPSFTQNILYVNSASAQIARLYSTEDENKMCVAIRNYNKRRRISYEDDTAPHPLSYKPGYFMNKWIKKFGIGESIEINGTDEGLGLIIFLNDGQNKRLLADEGYGITQLISLLLQIDNCIPLVGHWEYEAYLENDRIEDRNVFYYLPQYICVEEPEVHLHPKYQSLLAEMFVEANQEYNIRFIIETHSEYLIRKLQVMVADKENGLTSNDVSLNYVEKDENGVSHNRQIKILDDGGLSDSFGPGFYDEADTLAIQLFRNKPILS